MTKQLPMKRLLNAQRGESSRDHRVLLAGETEHCGDFTCHGECGLPKLIRKRPHDGCTEQATALMGVEPVWSSYRWNQSQPWKGNVVEVDYDEEDRRTWY